MTYASKYGSSRTPRTGPSGNAVSPAATQAGVPSKSTSSISPAAASCENNATAHPAGAASHLAKCCGVAGPYACR
ncbi:hypothetical protein GCM10027074_37920 [Streptomyces deserti]